MKSYFNFDLVSIEVTQAAKEAKKSTDQEIEAVGATKSFSSDMCRLRWSYIHLIRKTGRVLSYDPLEHKAQ